MARLKLGILISGRGSNLRALIESCSTPGYPAEIVTVVANRPDAAGLQYAAAAGIETQIIDHTAFADRSAFDAALDQALRQAGVDLVCLAGFMRLLTPAFVESWRDALINIHPSLLPSFRGLHTHRQTLEAGVRITGCTVHYVRSQTDTGPILVQAAVPVLPGDDEDTLAARVLTAEHQCYPLAVRMIADGQIRVENERAIIAAATPTGDSLINPLPTSTGLS